MTTWTNSFKHPIEYLTLESALTDFLLQENSDQIVLEQTGTATSLWTNSTKN